MGQIIKIKKLVIEIKDVEIEVINKPDANITFQDVPKNIRDDKFGPIERTPEDVSLNIPKEIERATRQRVVVHKCKCGKRLIGKYIKLKKCRDCYIKEKNKEKKIILCDVCKKVRLTRKHIIKRGTCNACDTVMTNELEGIDPFEEEE